jgi:DNA-binding ferritin-like protein
MLLSMLQAQHMMYLHHHWTSIGQSAYGNHLLFQRLYESVHEDIDGLAEKLVGFFGNSSVDLHRQSTWVVQHISRWSDSCPFRMSAKSEADIQTAFRSAYERIKDVGAMTLGLDDFIMASANKHETNQYLLQQVMQDPSSPKTASVVGQRFKAPVAIAPPANAWFFPNPEFRETREFVQSKALSNDKSTAAIAAREMDMSVKKEMKLVDQTPPTPSEIIQTTPLASQLSTLSRVVIDSTDVQSKDASSVWGWVFSTSGGV